MTTARRNIFNMLFQPHRIGRHSIRQRKRLRIKYLRRTQMQMMRANTSSRATCILSRVHMMRLTLVRIKTDRLVHPNRSFMLRSEEHTSELQSH